VKKNFERKMSKKIFEKIISFQKKIFHQHFLNLELNENFHCQRKNFLDDLSEKKYPQKILLRLRKNSSHLLQKKFLLPIQTPLVRL